NPALIRRDGNHARAHRFDQDRRLTLVRVPRRQNENVRFEEGLRSTQLIDGTQELNDAPLHGFLDVPLESDALRFLAPRAGALEAHAPTPTMKEHRGLRCSPESFRQDETAEVEERERR